MVWPHVVGFYLVRTIVTHAAARGAFSILSNEASGRRLSSIATAALSGASARKTRARNSANKKMCYQ